MACSLCLAPTRRPSPGLPLPIRSLCLTHSLSHKQHTAESHPKTPPVPPPVKPRCAAALLHARPNHEHQRLRLSLLWQPLKLQPSGPCERDESNPIPPHHHCRASPASLGNSCPSVSLCPSFSFRKIHKSLLLFPDLPFPCLLRGHGRIQVFPHPSAAGQFCSVDASSFGSSSFESNPMTVISIHSWSSQPKPRAFSPTTVSTRGRGTSSSTVGLSPVSPSPHKPPQKVPLGSGYASVHFHSSLDQLWPPPPPCAAASDEHPSGLQARPYRPGSEMTVTTPDPNPVTPCVACQRS